MTAMSELGLILVVALLSYMLGGWRTYHICRKYQEKAIKAQKAAIESLRRSAATDTRR